MNTDVPREVLGESMGMSESCPGKSDLANLLSTWYEFCFLRENTKVCDLVKMTRLREPWRVLKMGRRKVEMEEEVLR